MWKFKPCKITQCYKDKDGVIEVFCREGYLKLKDAGRIVWLMSDGENTIEEVVDALTGENAEKRETIYEGVTKLVVSLAKKELIIPNWDPLYKIQKGKQFGETEKLDVLLIMTPSPQPGLSLGSKVQGMPPLGLGYLATVLAGNGYKCRVLDFNVDYITADTLIDVLKNQRPEVVGISTTTETFKTGLRIAGIVKKLESESMVFMGGYHVTFAPEDALKCNDVDYVIRGEGERTVLKLCNTVLRGENTISEIHGVSYRKDGEIVSNPDVEFIQDLDSLPFPDRTLYDLDAYPHKGNCSTSRGCPGKCIFCAASGLSGGKYRMRSAKSIVEEFKYLKTFGVKHVDIVDDTMTASIKRLREFITCLKEADLGMSWYCESRVDVMSKELLIEMKDAGLRSIQFGVEAGSQKMLDCLKKNIKIEQIENVFLWCRELDIETSTCLIIGQPYDTHETIRDTIEMGKYIKSLGAHVLFTVSTPFPGTYMWNNAEDLKMTIENKDLNHYSTFEPVYNTPELTSQEIRNYYFDAVREVRRVIPFDGKKTAGRASLIRKESVGE